MKGMASYTKWALEFPWHFSGAMSYKYPSDTKGNCTCTCEWCKQQKAHKATRKAHGG